MVAEELGFRYADEQIIIRAAEKAGVAPDSVAQAEHTPGLIVRILESMASAPPMEPVGWSGYVMMSSQVSPSYEGLIQRVIRETADEGNVVIVAHGASIPLAGLSGLLRAFVTASPAVRAERLAGEANLDERQAKKTIADSDRQRLDYLRRFYDVRQELPTHYDLVVNTDVLRLPGAAQLIVSAARLR